MASNERVFAYPFSDIYRLYIKKIERKDRTVAELDEVLCWLTGYTSEGLADVVATEIDLQGFFDNAPKMNPNRDLITGSICGVKIVEIEDPLMKQIRQMDKVVDELAKGKSVEKIKRVPKA